MEGCIRILQINSGSTNYGGVSSFLFNLYMHIDRERVQFDFLSPEITTYGLHQDEILQAGGRIYQFGVEGNPITKKIRFHKKLKKLIGKNGYQIVHINSGNFFFNLLTAFAARCAKVPVRIVHSHNAGDTNNVGIKKLLTSLMRPLLQKNATHLAACSELAARFMFPSKTVDAGKVLIIPNGIETDQFRYDKAVREKVRAQMGLKDKFVIGNVARFMTQKNHAYLIEVFKQLSVQCEDAVLMLVGQGELQNKIKAQVKALNLEDKVLFLGQRNDVRDLYQAMDVFVLTSFHEGLPVTGIEVQSAGLPMVISDTITKELKINDEVDLVSLGSDIQAWVDAILKYRGTARRDQADKVAAAGYDINVVAEKMKCYYLKLQEEVG